MQNTTWKDLTRSVHTLKVIKRRSLPLFTGVLECSRKTLELCCQWPKKFEITYRSAAPHLSEISWSVIFEKKYFRRFRSSGIFSTLSKIKDGGNEIHSWLVHFPTPTPKIKKKLFLIKFLILSQKNL